MLRPRHRVKSNLLGKMLGIALLVNVLLWPILIRLGAFRGVRQELIPVTLVSKPPSHKRPVSVTKAPEKKPVVVQTATVPPAKPVSQPQPVKGAAAKPTPVKVAAAKPATRKPKPVQVVAIKPVTHHPSVLAKRPARTVVKTALRPLTKRPAARIAIAPTPAKPPKKSAAQVPSRPVRVAVKPSPVVPPVTQANSPDQTTPTEPDNTMPPSETAPLVLRPAVAIVKVQPSIPRSMEFHVWHALFRGEFDVDKEGDVTPHMVSSTGNAELDARALTAAKHWKFRPATQDGVPIASKVKFEIEYAVRAVP